MTCHKVPFFILKKAIIIVKNKIHIAYSFTFKSSEPHMFREGNIIKQKQQMPGTKDKRRKCSVIAVIWEEIGNTSLFTIKSLWMGPIHSIFKFWVGKNHRNENYSKWAKNM